MHLPVFPVSFFHHVCLLAASLCLEGLSFCLPKQSWRSRSESFFVLQVWPTCFVPQTYMLTCTGTLVSFHLVSHLWAPCYLWCHQPLWSQHSVSCLHRALVSRGAGAACLQLGYCPFVLEMCTDTAPLKSTEERNVLEIRVASICVLRSCCWKHKEGSSLSGLFACFCDYLLVYWEMTYSPCETQTSLYHTACITLMEFCQLRIKCGLRKQL